MLLNLQVDPNDNSNWMLVREDLRPSAASESKSISAMLKRDVVVEVYVLNNTKEVYAIVMRGISDKVRQDLITDCRKDIESTWRKLIKSNVIVGARKKFEAAE